MVSVPSRLTNSWGGEMISLARSGRCLGSNKVLGSGVPDTTRIYPRTPAWRYRLLAMLLIKTGQNVSVVSINTQNYIAQKKRKHWIKNSRALNNNKVFAHKWCRIDLHLIYIRFIYGPKQSMINRECFVHIIEGPTDSNTRMYSHHASVIGM